MTERVDFYVLGSDVPKQRWVFACRLAEKAYLRDLTVVLLSESAADARAIDELLWTFNERSFVPHGIDDPSAPPDPETPVRLTQQLGAVAGADLLVNLTTQVPREWQRFARIAEIIDGDAERRRLGRERFRAYRDLKLPLQTHRLNDAEID